MKRLRKNVPLLFTLVIFLGFVFFIFCAAHNGSPFHKSRMMGDMKSVIINMSLGENPFYRSQISAPSSYLVTSETMIDRYDSQGGMAPPRLILMKGYQVTDSEKYYNEVIQNPSHECIAIWTTGSFGSIDDWSSNILQFQGKITDVVTFPLGKRTATMRTNVMKDKTIYEAYLQVDDKDGGTSYYFNTCNEKNKEDFLSVVRSLKIRADLNL